MLFPNAYLFKFVQIGGSWTIWCKTSNPIRNYQRLCLFSPGVTYPSDYILGYTSLCGIPERSNRCEVQNQIWCPWGLVHRREDEDSSWVSTVGATVALGTKWRVTQSESTQRLEDDNVCFKKWNSKFQCLSYWGSWLEIPWAFSFLKCLRNFPLKSQKCIWLITLKRLYYLPFPRIMGKVVYVLRSASS